MVTAGDLLNKKFSKAKMGGYRTAEVDSFLIDAAELFSKQTREIAELKRKLDADQQKLTDYEKDSDSLREALVNAQKLADRIVRDARGKAELTLRDAEIKAEKIVEHGRQDAEAQQQALADLKREVSDFRSRLLDMYRDHLRLITSLPALAEEDEAAAGDDGQEEPAQEPAPDDAAAPSADSAAAESAEPAEETPAEPDDQPAGPHEGGEPASSPADEAAAAEEPGYHVKLNVRYDEQTGEYVPTSPDDGDAAGNQ